MSGPAAALRVLSVAALKAAAIHSLAVTTYCSLFGLMSLITRRTLVIGIVYTAVVEGVLANLPFGIRLATVIYYTRLIAYRTMPFVIANPGGRREDIAAIAWQLDVVRDPKLLDHPQFSTCFIVLLVAAPSVHLQPRGFARVASSMSRRRRKRDARYRCHFTNA